MTQPTPYRFCPFDGTPLRPAAGRGECPTCRFVDYANPKSCAGFFVVENGRVLLARRAHEPAKGMWDIPGGFLEAGESAEDAVVREAEEETTLTVEVAAYLGSVPDVYRSGEQTFATLNFIYLVRRTAGEPQARDDVAELRWFPLDAVPTDLAFAHQPPAVELLRAYLAG